MDIYLVASVTSCVMLTHIYRLKNNMNCLVWENIPQPPYTTVFLLGNDVRKYVRKYYLRTIREIWQVNCLFSYLITITAKFFLHSKHESICRVSSSTTSKSSQNLVIMNFGFNDWGQETHFLGTWIVKQQMFRLIVMLCTVGSLLK